MNVLPDKATVVRAVMLMGVAVGVTACASEPVTTQGSFGPIMMLHGPSASASATVETAAADPLQDLTKKSLAAKVLTSRALETVTGLQIDPARLSEHD